MKRLFQRHENQGHNSDAALDELLGTVNEQLLTRLTTGLDLDAGLAAILPDGGGDWTQPQPSEPGSSGASVATDGPAPRATALDLVAALLDGWLATLAPLASPATRPPDGVGASVMSLAAVCRLIAQLHHGLIMRMLDRPSADRLARLVEHNLDEAIRLMSGEQRAARKQRARDQIGDWLAQLREIRQDMDDLRPRIARLFDDSDQTTDPRPRVPR